MAARPCLVCRLPSSAGITCLPLIAICGALFLAADVRFTGAVHAEEKDSAAGKRAEKEKKEADRDTPDSKAQMAAMRRIAAGLKVTAMREESHDLELIPEPLFRLYDPARNHSDGTIWGFGKTGRPAALLTLALHPRQDGTLGWLFEMNSLSAHPVSAKIPGGFPAWSTRQSGLDIKIMPDAAEPADKETARSRQLRELSARFAGFEFLQQGSGEPFERYELRLIPRPIYRYSDLAHGLIDGAIFLMTHTTNPEIIMVLEAVRDGEKSVWKYGFTRCAYAEVHVELDGKDVWTQPHLRETSLSDPYWLTFQPIPGGALPLGDTEEK